MKKYNFSKGNNLTEYVVIFLLVGLVIGFTIWSINPTVFTSYFQYSFAGNNTNSQGNITVGPLGE